VNVFLVRIDAELEFVVSAGLDDGRVTRVELRRVQVVGVFLVLKSKVSKLLFITKKLKIDGNITFSGKHLSVIDGLSEDFES
jgi:hypothetical protein